MTLATPAPCRHRDIRTYEFVGGSRIWACEECARRFYPACLTCVDVGHRNEEHVAPALDVEALTLAERLEATHDGHALSVASILRNFAAAYAEEVTRVYRP